MLKSLARQNQPTTAVIYLCNGVLIWQPDENKINKIIIKNTKEKQNTKQYLKLLNMKMNKHTGCKREKKKKTNKTIFDMTTKDIWVKAEHYQSNCPMIYGYTRT